MYQQIAIVVACLVGLSQASYLHAPLAAPAIPVAAPAPVLAAPSFTTAAHVGNVNSVSRSYSNVPQSRFTRTDWNQPGSLISQPVFSPIVAPTFGTITVPGPTRYEQFLVPRPALVENFVSHVAGVAHVPTVAHVPAAVPVAAPVAAPVAPAYGPGPVGPAYGAPVKGY